MHHLNFPFSFRFVGLITFLFALLLGGCSAPKTSIHYIQSPLIPPEITQDLPSKPQWKPTKGMVVIDAGHGGKDLGTHSFNSPQYEEKLLTLSTARLLKTYLEQLGYATLLTRNDDTFIPLNKRAEFANRHCPHAFVSIHFNSAPNKEANGIEIFYYRSDQDKTRSRGSKLLAQKVLDRMLQETGAKSRGVKHGDLAVIRETQMAAILVEGGFLSNKEEARQLKNGIYLKKLAWGMAQGIDDFITNSQ